VIFYEETLGQSTDSGKPFVEVLHERGVIPGIKVDKGTGTIPGSEDETFTQGLDGLAERCKKYYQQGARFSKWRAVLQIDTKTGCPSEASILANAYGLAAYGAISQSCGLVPIIEPEILPDGPHDLATCAKVTEKVLAAVFKALHDYNILFEGMLLKPNMVLPGTTCVGKELVTPEQIALATITTLQRHVPPAVPSINFLSGGQGEEEATLNLNAMNKLPNRPWSVSFSYGRALQASVIKTWAGKPENIPKAQQVYLERARANGLANLGKYTGDAATDLANASLFEKDYKY